MAHIGYSTDLLKSIELLASMKAKFAEEGDYEALVLMLAKQKIDLDIDILKEKKPFHKMKAFIKPQNMVRNTGKKKIILGETNRINSEDRNFSTEVLC